MVWNCRIKMSFIVCISSGGLCSLIKLCRTNFYKGAIFAAFAEGFSLIHVIERFAYGALRLRSALWRGVADQASSSVMPRQDAKTGRLRQKRKAEGRSSSPERTFFEAEGHSSSSEGMLLKAEGRSLSSEGTLLETEGRSSVS